MTARMMKGKTIVVSGGTKGIGRGVIIECASLGAKVVIGGRDEKAAGEILSKVASFGVEGIFVRTDFVNHPEDCEKLFDETMRHFGRVDGFVNYAGVTTRASLSEATAELFDTTFALNTRAALLCSRACVNYMRQGGGGSIVMVGSLHTWCGEEDRVIYAMSKGALMTLTNHLSRHYAKDNIRCNYVTVGWVATEGELALREGYGMDDHSLHEYAKGIIPMGRMQEVEDHVPGIVYLLSDLASQVTGSNLKVSGGLYI